MYSLWGNFVWKVRFYFRILIAQLQHTNFSTERKEKTEPSVLSSSLSVTWHYANSVMQYIWSTQLKFDHGIDWAYRPTIETFFTNSFWAKSCLQLHQYKTEINSLELGYSTSAWVKWKSDFPHSSGTSLIHDCNLIQVFNKSIKSAFKNSKTQAFYLRGTVEFHWRRLGESETYAA